MLTFGAALFLFASLHNTKKDTTRSLRRTSCSGAFVLLDAYDLRQLDESYSEDALVFKKLELCYGKKALDEVRRLQSNEIDYKHDPNAPKLPELQIEIWNAMEHADGECYENSFKIKLARYELRESFERLIDSLYPR